LRCRACRRAIVEQSSPARFRRAGAHACRAGRFNTGQSQANRRMVRPFVLRRTVRRHGRARARCGRCGADQRATFESRIRITVESGSTTGVKGATRMFDRRKFLFGSGALVSLAPLVPSMLCRAARAAGAETDARVLVVIQLDGGNDGLNTVVPYADDGYGRARNKLRLAANTIHKLDDRVGLHPRMAPAKQLFDDGRLTIVQGVGYPNPDRSHFRSMRIWQTARFDDDAHDSYGWLGRAMDSRVTGGSADARAYYVGDEQTPVALWGPRSTAVGLSKIEDLTLAAMPALASVESA